MYFITALLFYLVLCDKTFGFQPSYYNYNPLGKKRSSAATAISSGNTGASMISLDGDLSAKMQQAVGGYTENLSRKIQADVDASLKQSLASFGNFGFGQGNRASALSGGGFGDTSGFGGGFGGGFNIFGNMDKTFSDISKTIQDSQTQSRKLQDDMQDITNQALAKAAKSGNLNVVSATSVGGPVAIASSTNINGKGSGFVYNGGTDGNPGTAMVVSSSNSVGGQPKMQVVSNVPVHVQRAGGEGAPYQQPEEGHPQEEVAQRGTYGTGGQRRHYQRTGPQNPAQRKKFGRVVARNYPMARKRGGYETQ